MLAQPWMNPKPVQDIMGYKWEHISSGGVTLFCGAQDPKEGDFVVSWGQGATYGELALGPGSVSHTSDSLGSFDLLNRLCRSQAKSSTKPARIDYLDGIEMLDIAAGQNTTFFIARPPPTEKAKAEAKQLENVPAPVAAAPALPLKDDTPADSPGASAFKPSIDLSGFGFAFGAPSTGASDSKPASSGDATPVNEAERKKNADGISRTQQGAWEELPRWPTLYDAQDECNICSKVENEAKGDSLECEKVSLPCSVHSVRWRS